MNCSEIPNCSKKQQTLNMNEEEITKMNREILELVNASAQHWQTKKESERLLHEARKVAQIRNDKMDRSYKLMTEKFR